MASAAVKAASRPPAAAPAPTRGAEDRGGAHVDWIGLYLLEDLGAADITSEPMMAGRAGHAAMVARQPCVVAGLRHAAEVFARLGATATTAPGIADGGHVAAGATLMKIEGPAAAILAGERVALNIVGRMSGIATATAGLQATLAKAGSHAQVAATRKTTPGFRAFEKEAVVLGGGAAHRMGLFDEAMLKDNHLEAWAGKPLEQAPASDVAAAVGVVVAANPGRIVCCEAESLEHALAAAQAGAHWVLIDNQAPATGARWAAALRARFPSVRIEASGGITAATIAQYGWADRVSLGALTAKAAAVDVGLDWMPGGRGP